MVSWTDVAIETIFTTATCHWQLTLTACNEALAHCWPNVCDIEPTVTQHVVLWKWYLVILTVWTKRFKKLFDPRSTKVASLKNVALPGLWAMVNDLESVWHCAKSGHRFVDYWRTTTEYNCAIPITMRIYAQNYCCIFLIQLKMQNKKSVFW